MRSLRLLFGTLCLSAAPVFAQQTETPPDEAPAVREDVVVSASRAEERLVNAPATVTVVGSDRLRDSPAQSMGDLLRTVPGLNVVQLSARDVNLTSRAATSTLATSQLALVDGRTIYLDFFGMIMWDLVPTSRDDVARIEIIRGPASAVWGANAMTGVVNIITKTPRELAAESPGTVTIGVGAFDQSPGSGGDLGGLFSVSASHARAVNDRWAYRVSAGYYTQDALPRPAGAMPNSFQTPYPAFANMGTSQPKFDGRVDYDLPDGSRLSVSGGVAATQGIIHTGIGPFRVEPGSRLGYVSTRWARGNRRLAFFANALNGGSTNLLTVGADETPIRMDFVTKTFDVEAGDALTIGRRHLLTFGGNYRHNRFDFTLAPQPGTRDEGGVYLQDEIFFTDHVRWVVGGRLDKSSVVPGVVFSPRTTLLLKPAASQTFRVSYTRGFRAPSYVNSDMDTTIVDRLNLGLINPALDGSLYDLPIRALGNADLEPETLTAYEVGYTGILRNRATVTAAVYWNESDGTIYFTQTARYGAADPPPDWPLPPLALEALAAAGSPLPSTFSYRNLSRVTNRGFELGVDASLTRQLAAYANYSYQADPDAADAARAEINRPPNHRVNVGADLSVRRFFGGVAVSRTSDAFWQDVLDQRFHGATDGYTLVNASVGARWRGDQLVTAIKAGNITNARIMQHVFGDIVTRQVTGEIRVGF